MAEGVLTIGAVLGNYYQEYIGEEPAEWLRKAVETLERTYHWAKESAERHEELHKIFTFLFLFGYTSRRIFLGFVALVWGVFSFLLGSVWVAFSFIVGCLWGGISFVAMSLWAVLAVLLGSVWVAFSFIVGCLWVGISFVAMSLWAVLAVLLGSLWIAIVFVVGYFWAALCFLVGSVWVALCFLAALVWAALPILVVSGLVVYGGILVYAKYQTGIELFLTTLKTNPNPKGPLIRIYVSNGSVYRELIIPAYSTFGDVKKRLGKKNGLEQGDRLLLFRGVVMKDEEHLHTAGVTDESSVLIF